uniref:NB-ARC domain-containing protein n=1 Tax=Fagus sylvatica TaxID=28930 RepID=A0A2N9G418_FAGSY
MLEVAASAAASAAVVEVYKDGRVLYSNMKQKIDYANDLENNYKRLKEKAATLNARKEDILYEANKYTAKQLTKECDLWVSRVTNGEEDVRELTTKYENLKSKKVKWRRRSKRAKLSKSMVEKCEELHSLWLEGKFERGIMVEKLPERVRTLDAAKIEDKPSLYKVVEEILGLLKDRDVKRIGLWGSAGIGKTTIMKNLNNHEDIAEMFDIVIWVTISKDRSEEKLQRAITERLKMNMEDITNPDEIAWRISKELECKKYLLLLDEVCNTLDLPKLEKVGQNVNLPSIEPIAKLVVRECAGFPLVIDKVASAFRQKKDNSSLWNYGLTSLRRWDSFKVQGMDELDELIEFLKFCYEGLDSKYKKFCFLYGALYPEDCEIHRDYLIECWRAEGFICDVNKFSDACGEGHKILQFRDARDEGHKMLLDLINVSLLEESEKMNHVRMNKVLRNMALKISSKSKTFKVLVKTEKGLEEPPNAVEWQQVNRISLMDNKLCSLPELPDCNNVSTLFLQRNRDLKVIPDTFFGCMQNLRVLDLHGTGIESLPSSVSLLKCLRALYLNSCISLMELHYLEELQLEVLDIRGTGINHLPIQIRGLLQLKCLRMSLSNFGRGQLRDVEIQPNVFSNLYLLEELRIDVDPNNQEWEALVEAIIEERCFKFANGEGVNPVISEVLAETDAFGLIGHKGASRLSDFGIENINRMRVCLIEGCDEIETIVHGNSVDKSALEWLQKMCINNAQKLESIWEGPIHAGSLARLTTLTLQRCPKLKKIFSNGMIEQLFKLEHLSVEECLEIEEIITNSENTRLEPGALPKLKTLVLSDLPRVKCICTVDLLKWPALERITISRCQLLTRLPLNKENAPYLRRIEGNQLWWTALEWKEDAIKGRFESFFKSN